VPAPDPGEPMSETDLPEPTEQAAGSRTGLTGDQDARLRTLAALRELGELAPELQELRRSYRERDQRTAVRPPPAVTWPGSTGTGGPA
jgi:hypothetical protein